MDNNTGTPSATGSVSGSTLSLDFHNLKGATGAAGAQGPTGPQGPQGDTGEAGADGNGIESAVLNSDYTLSLRFTDGTSYTTPSIRGAQGATGATGATGPQGESGPQGPAGSTGAAAGFGTPTASINSGTGTPSVSVSASGPDTAKVFNFTFSNIKGDTGATGPQGPAGSDADVTAENITAALGYTPASSSALAGKQDTLVSGSNIKTVNNVSLLGGGNITIEGVGISTVTSAQDGTIVITLTNGDEITVDLNHVHPQYLKYVHLTDESSMPATPDDDTLYLIDESNA